MTHYSREFKEATLLKLSKSGLSARAFAKQESINISTLYSWQQRYSSTGFKVTDKAPDKWSTQEKFAVVLETSTMNEVDLSEYCRKKGLYPDQVKSWKQACLDANKEAPKQIKNKADSKQDKRRIKHLENELKRKEKALAEAAALLVLGKKFDAYWKDKEDS